MGPFAAGPQENTDDEVLAALAREVESASHDPPHSIDDDSQDQLFAPLQNNRRPKRRDKRPNAGMDAADVLREDETHEQMLNVGQKYRKSEEASQSSVNEIDRNMFEQFTKEKQSSAAIEAKYRDRQGRSRTRAAGAANASFSLGQGSSNAARAQLVDGGDENFNPLNASAGSH